jgi:hypothetical protein
MMAQMSTRARTEPSLTSVRSNVLQRKCACGQHTAGDGGMLVRIVVKTGLTGP